MDLQRAAYAAVTKQLASLDKIEAKRVPEGTVQASIGGDERAHRRDCSHGWRVAIIRRASLNRAEGFCASLVRPSSRSSMRRRSTLLTIRYPAP